jgi:hypothetical protein
MESKTEPKISGFKYNKNVKRYSPKKGIKKINIIALIRIIIEEKYKKLFTNIPSLPIYTALIFKKPKNIRASLIKLFT